jgi:UDP-3-O-[3-hydroxymyristoyl] glucosamine N-acyltransferase
MTTRTLNDLAKACGAALEGDGTRRVSGPASLRDARPDEISFCGHPRFRAELERTQAAAVLVPRDMVVARKDIALLRCEDSSRAFTTLVRLFAPVRAAAKPGVHASAIVDPSAELGANVAVAALAHVGAGARIGARTIVHAQVEIGDNCQIGEDCEVFPGAVLYERVQLGSRCVIHAGCVLGSDGHGFDPRPEGWVKIPQYGTVVVEDDVEIGANTTIDRARFGVTRIGRGTKIDNLVHIGHNVVIGPNSMIIAQVGISGSTRLGRGVVIGGQTGINGHLELGDGVRVGGNSGVLENLPAGSQVWGFPARPFKETVRNMARATQADDLTRRVRELEKRLKKLEQTP